MFRTMRIHPSLTRQELASWTASLLATALAAVGLSVLTAPAASADLATTDRLCVTNTGSMGVGVQDLTWGPDGNLWFALKQGGIGRRTPQGHVTLFSKGIRDDGYARSITVGPDGNLWFVSVAPDKQWIGRITTAGVITMFADGITPGSQPDQIVAGPDGNLWFTENNHTAIGRITPAGVVTEFPYQFDPDTNFAAGAFGLAVGPNGDLYFTLPGGIGRMTTAGVATVYTEGLAIEYDGAPSILHVTRGQETSITAGPDGNLWFARAGRFTDPQTPATIGTMTPDGVVTNVAEVPLISPSPTDAGLPTVTDLVFGPDGNLWFTDPFSSRIGSVTSSGELTVQKIENLLDGQVPVGVLPHGLAVGPDGALWYGEWVATGQLRGRPAGIGRITTAGVFTSPSLDTPLGLQQSADATTGPDGLLWYTDGLAVHRILADGGVEQVASLVGAGGIATGADDNLWITRPDKNEVARLTPSGTVTSFTAGISPGAKPLRILAGTDGNLWFTEPGVDKIGRITPAGEVTEFAAGITADAGIEDFATGPDGVLWFTESEAFRIARIDSDGVVTEYPLGAPGDGYPGGITTGPDGNVWFTVLLGDPNADDAVLTGRVGRMTPDGAITYFEDGLADDPDRPSYPLDITSAGGALWFTDRGAGQLGRITTDGAITLFDPTSPDTGSGTLNGIEFRIHRSVPLFIKTTPDGTLWWTDFNPANAYGTAHTRDDVGDPCNPDEDGDGHDDEADTFPFDAEEWADTDTDGIGDNGDNCPAVTNAGQLDTDHDGLGDVCDPDDDGDSVLDTTDNCPLLANADQADSDQDGIGDVCDRQVVLTIGSKATYFTVTARDGAGHPVAGIDITFARAHGKRAGKKVCAATTTSAGEAECALSLKKLRRLSHGYTATFAGDALHDPASVTRTGRIGPRYFTRYLIIWLVTWIFHH